jgi:hypothetical protein
MTTRRRSSLTASLVATALCIAITVPVEASAAYKSCARIVNPYAGTRYDGSDLYRIRALEVSCRTARRVVRRGHRKALADVPDADGFVHVTYRRWSITGDLRGDHDRYVARAAGEKRVRWLF